MAYSGLRTFVDGTTIVASDMNKIKNNFLAGIPGAYTAKGQIQVATGSGAASALSVGSNGAWYWADSSATVGITTCLPGRLRAYNSTGGSAISYGAWTKVTWITSETYDSAAAYSTGRYTAAHPGYYLVCFQSGFNLADLGGTGHTKYEWAIYKNGVKRSIIAAYYFRNRREQYYWMRGIDVIQLDRGDYIELYYYSNQPSNAWTYTVGSADAVHLDVHPLR
jgi:hypothetical protein